VSDRRSTTPRGCLGGTAGVLKDADRLIGPTTARHGRHQLSVEITANASSPGGYREHVLPRGSHHLVARDYAGEEPAIVLLHGFPDNQHLYDRLVPELARRRVVTFDSSTGENPTSPSATRTLPATRPATPTPSSRTCSSPRLCWSPTTSPAHRRSTGPSSTRSASRGWSFCTRTTTASCPGGCAPGGDLAVLHPGRPSRRPSGVDVVRAAVSPPVPGTGGALVPRRARRGSVHTAALRAVLSSPPRRTRRSSGSIETCRRP
jgi:hypothetical protein